MMSRLTRLIALLVLLALFTTTPVKASWSEADSDADADADSEMDGESESDSLADIDQSVLDSAAQEIESTAELSEELNHAELTHFNKDETAPANGGSYAFLAELESPKNAFTSVDVESHLDDIASDIGSLFEASATVRSTKKGASQGRLASKKVAHRMNAKSSAARSTASVSASSAQPSRRQQKLISRLDGYRVARGHTDDISALESTANSKQAVGNGYSFPSAYAPGVVPAAAPAAVGFNPFQGQVNVNPALAAGNNALLQSLGLGLPTQAVAAPAPVTAPAVSGVGNLLAALKALQQEQQNKALLSSLATLLNNAQRAAAPVAPQVPQVIQSPFNYGQSYVATPQGYVNPNLLPQTFGPRLLPGQLAGQSPSYPTYIPAGNAGVGVSDDQPNPFEDHKP